MKKLLLLLSVVGMIFTACENFGADDPQLSQIEVVGGEESLSLNFPSDGVQTKTVAFKSNYDWSVTVSESWIKVSPESGEAGEECQITVSLDRNDSGETRSGKITISIEGLSIDLAVTQSHEGNTAIIPNNEIWYTSTDGAVVTPYITNAFGANIVSNTYENGKGVITFDGDITSIGEDAFFFCTSLTSVTIPNSVTSIGYAAFAGCTSLTSVTIPNSVTSIGEGTFQNCTSLTSVTIGNGVTSIGQQAFYNCTSLTSVTIPDSVTSIGRSAFSSCTSLTSVTIGNSVTSIGNGAFSGCSSLNAFYGKFASADNRCLIVDGVLNAFAPAGLTEYTIPNGVTSIGNSAFEDCRNLTSVTIPDSVTSIGSSAFSSCYSLISVTIPDSVTSIGNGAFSGCSSLNAFYGKFASADNRCLIVDGVLNAFAPAGLTEYTIPNGVTSIGNSAFSGCRSLTSVTIPDSVTSIGKGAFAHCNSLTSVTIPDGVTSIEDNTFMNCHMLKNVIMGNRVTSIGAQAFGACQSLTSITIPAGVASIGKWAFRYCTSLTEVYCKPTTPPTAIVDWGHWNAFYDNASSRKIYVPRNSVSAYKAASGWSGYASYIVGYDF